MDICVIERIILSLFSDFHSLTFLKTDKPQICSKSINHSIIQSFNHLLLVSITIESETDQLTYCVNHRINEPIHKWMNDAYCMQWITIIRLSWLTYWHSVTKILYIQSFFHPVIFSCFYLVNAWLRDWIDAYSVCYYLSMSNKQQGKKE